MAESLIEDGPRFFVEPKVKTIRGEETTRWELSRRSAAHQTIVIGDYSSKTAAMRGLVTHPRRQGYGEVGDTDAPAWTPDTLAVDPPDVGMVKVRWFDRGQASQLCWEYAIELRTAEDD